jgi:hypothetical protein
VAETEGRKSEPAAGIPLPALLVGRMRLEPSIAKVGGLAAFGVAASYVASGLSAIMMPAELQGRPDVTPHQFWSVLSQTPTAHLAFHWSWIAAGLFGLGAVPAISLLVWEASPGAVLWSGAAAFSGFAVLARSHLMEIAFDQRIIAAYPHADPAFQQAVHVVAGLALDVPDGFLTYGAIGVWVAVVSRLGLRRRLLPAPVCFVGFAASLTYLAGVLGYTFAIRPLVVVAVGVGGLLLVPAWYASLGVLLRHRA